MLRLAAAGLAMVLTTTSAQAASPILTARPASVPMTLKTGITSLGEGAFAYRPAKLPAGPRPLLVLLRGALGTARDPINYFRPLADKNGWLLVSPEAAERSWRARPSRQSVDFGVDPPRIDTALSRIFAAAPVDPQQIALVGFSDGASYGLSLGAANPDLFRGIVALSPGYAWVPREVDPAQRIFIAHGRADEILSPSNVRDQILPDLKAAGLKPQMRWFTGGHVINRAVLDEALNYVLGQP